MKVGLAHVHGFQGCKNHWSANQFSSGIKDVPRQPDAEIATFSKRTIPLCTEARKKGFAIAVADRYGPVVLDSQTVSVGEESKHSCAARSKRFQESDVCKTFITLSGTLWVKVIHKLHARLQQKNRNLCILKCFGGLEEPVKLSKVGTYVSLYDVPGLGLTPKGQPLSFAYRIKHPSYWPHQVTTYINNLLANVTSLTTPPTSAI